jgi:hypothetical protein
MTNLFYLGYNQKYKRKEYRHEYFFNLYGANKFIKIDNFCYYAGLYIVSYIGKGFTLDKNLKQFYFCSQKLQKSETVYESIKSGQYLDAVLLKLGISSVSINDFAITYQIFSEDIINQLIKDDEDNLLLEKK